MYLSQLRLNPSNPSARRDLADAYQMHRTLSRVYAAGQDTTPSRFLWRLERNGPDSDSAVVLVQSGSPGRWHALDEQPGYLTGMQADKLVNLEPLVVNERRLRFRLLANPTVKRDGKRIGLNKEDEQLAWLGRQGQRAGFDVLGAVRGSSERISVVQGRGGTRITVVSALFDGVLSVKDPAALRLTLVGGLGHAKALGLGMLSVAPT